jgi:hypothetical protein
MTIMRTSNQVRAPSNQTAQLLLRQDLPRSRECDEARPGCDLRGWHASSTIRRNVAKYRLSGVPGGEKSHGRNGTGFHPENRVAILARFVSATRGHLNSI